MRIALDDFGTGYSSLSYLHTLPLDKVKIDRSFLIDVTQNPRSLELLKGIVNLARPLGLTITIEGVETFEQLKILSQSVKPDLLQGFLFGSALSASGIETMSGNRPGASRRKPSAAGGPGRPDRPSCSCPAFLLAQALASPAISCFDAIFAHPSRINRTSGCRPLRAGLRFH